VNLILFESYDSFGGKSRVGVIYLKVRNVQGFFAPAYIKAPKKVFAKNEFS
jgi:hypothetical protein